LGILKTEEEEAAKKEGEKKLSALDTRQRQKNGAEIYSKILFSAR